MMGVMDDGAWLMRRNCADMRSMIGCRIFSARRWAFARTAGARSGKRDECRKNGAEQRQKNDRLIHPRPVSLSSD